MGRTILCPHCKSTFNEDILKAKNSMDIGLVCGGSLLDGTDSNAESGDEHPDWITWYYYGFKVNNGRSGSLRDKPIDLEKFGDDYFLIKEFKAPPEDGPGGLDKVKEILRTYVPDAFEEPVQTVISCPWCGSTEYTMMNRGYWLFRERQGQTGMQQMQEGILTSA